MVTKTKSPSTEVIQYQKTDLYYGYTENNMENPDRVLIANDFRVDEFLLAIYRRIVRKDAHIYSCLQTRKHKILEKDFDVYPGSEDKQDIEIADFMKRQIFDELINFHQDLMETLTAMECGFSVSEKLYAIKNNHLIIKKLKFKTQDHFAFDYSGNLRWASIDRANPKILDQSKFLIHRFGGDDENPYGESIISERLYWLYFFKHEAWPMLMNFLERFGSPVPILNYDDKKHEDKCKEAIESFHNEFGLALPQGVMAQLLEWKTSGNKLAHETVIKLINAEMSKGILGQTLTTEQTGNSSSLAQSKVHNSVLDSYTAFDCISLQSTLNNQMIKPLVRWNFGEVENYPVLKFKLEPEVDLKSMAERDKILYSIGLKFSKSYLHETYNIPLDEKEYEEKENIKEENEEENDVSEDNNLSQKEGNEGEAKETADSRKDGGDNEDEDKGKPHRDYFSDDKTDPDEIIKKQYKELDRQIQLALNKHIILQEKLNIKIKKLIEREFHFSTIKSLFNKLFKKKGGEKGLEKKDLNPLAENLADITFYAYYLGQFHGQNLTDKKLYFAENAFVFTEAVNYFANKLPISYDEFKSKHDALHGHFFTVAGVNNEKLLNGIKGRIANGIKDGTPLKEIQNNINTFFDKEGFTMLNPHHLETVVRNNVGSAYMEGKKEQMSSPAMRKAFPYWRYSAIMDSRTRPAHVRLHGLVLPNDDPIWDIIFPKKAHRCRCDVSAVDGDYLEREGVKPPKKNELVFVFNDRDKILKNPIEKPLGKIAKGSPNRNLIRVKKDSFSFDGVVDKGFEKPSPLSDILNRSSKPFREYNFNGENIPVVNNNEDWKIVVQYKESNADFASEIYKGIQLDIDYGNDYGINTIKDFIDETKTKAPKLIQGLKRIVYLEGEFLTYENGDGHLSRGWYDHENKTIYLFNAVKENKKEIFWHELGHHTFHEHLLKDFEADILKHDEGREIIADIILDRLLGDQGSAKEQEDNILNLAQKTKDGILNLFQ